MIADETQIENDGKSVESDDSDKTIDFATMKTYPATATMPEWLVTASDEESEEDNIGEVNGKVYLVGSDSSIEKVRVDEVGLVW
jgi:hypothetical protein